MNVCLSMMAKAESETVLAALRSAAPFVESICLVVAPGDPLLSLPLPLPGRILEHAWEGFAKTRDFALKEAEKDGDWVLTLDSDDRFGQGGTLPDLAQTKADAFDLRVVSCSRAWYRPHLTRSGIGWRIEGIGASGLHEGLYGKPGARVERWDGLVYESGDNDTRSHARYARDAALLEIDCATSPTDTRAAFYLAQSYRDAGEFEKARKAYLRRAELGGWDEEVFWSFLEAGQLTLRLGLGKADASELFRRAAELCPERAEPLCALAGLLRAEALGFEQRAGLLPYPTNARLFVDPQAYPGKVVG